MPKNEVKGPKTKGEMLQKAEELIDYLEVNFGYTPTYSFLRKVYISAAETTPFLKEVFEILERLRLRLRRKRRGGVDRKAIPVDLETATELFKDDYRLD